MKTRLWRTLAVPLCAIACFLAALPASAQFAARPTAISARQLGVVIAEGDPVSEAIGALYQKERGIPPENVVRVRIPVGAEDVPSEAFAAIRAAVNEQLPGHVQATLLTWIRPFAVRGRCRMSITSAFAFGYDDKYCISAPGKLLTAPSPYFDSESARPWDDFAIRPSMMLGASTLAAAQALIARGKAADGSAPAGTGYLIRTTEAARSVRWPDFAQIPALYMPGALTIKYIDNSAGKESNYITGKQGVLFYFTGLATVPMLNTNTYVPGAVGDHLTSAGGLLTAGNSQMAATAWIDAGLTGSYGTVEEPYSLPDKFPRASVLIDHYYRGATLIEAYWKSVRTPGEGLFLGEPLARPFADSRPAKTPRKARR